MTGRDWEAAGRARLEKLVADTVERIRDTAAEIEREARRNIASAAKSNRDLEFQTYPRAASQVTHSIQTLVFNLKLDSLVDAAVDAEKARDEKRNAEKVTGDPDSQAGRILALAAMERVSKGWADGTAENEEAMGRRDRKPSNEQPFVLSDILNMIDDAAREVGVAPVYGERSKKP